MKDYVKEVLEELNAKQEAIILQQLGDLVKRGLLVVESTQPVLVKTESPLDEYKFEVKQSVRLVLKNKEYVEKLEAENAFLKQKVNQLKDWITQDLKNEMP